MSDEPPTPPANLPPEIVNTLNESTPERLRDVATYAEELAEHMEREARLGEEVDQDEVEERPDDQPADVPAKATITIKEINDSRYYYWQWREGDKVTSKYSGPVGSRGWIVVDRRRDRPAGSLAVGVHRSRCESRRVFDGYAGPALVSDCVIVRPR